MILQLGDDGVVSSVDEEELVYVDKKELEQFIESYQELEEENEQLKSENKELKEELIEYIEQTSSDKPNKKGFVGNGRFA